MEWIPEIGQLLAVTGAVLAVIFIVWLFLEYLADVIINFFGWRR